MSLSSAACSILYTRPVQDMSDTSMAIRAAREVQGDTLAPELFRQANEWFFRAKHEYKFKNFKLAKEYAEKARYFAEMAEFESIRNGGTRTDQATTDPLANPGAPGGPGGPPEAAPAAAAPKPAPYDYPTPTPTPFEGGGAPSPSSPPAPPSAPAPAPNK